LKKSLIVTLFILLIILTLSFFGFYYSPSCFLLISNQTLRIIFYILLNPVFWVLVAGPIIIGNQDLSLNKHINELSNEDIEGYIENSDENNKQDIKREIVEEFTKFKSIFNEKNRPALAWNDVNNQLIVTVLSLILAISDTLKDVYHLLYISQYTFKETLDILLSSPLTIFVIISLICLTIFVVFFGFLSRRLFNKKNFFPYIRLNRSKLDKWKVPPKTQLSSMRILILLYAVLLMIWKLYAVQGGYFGVTMPRISVKPCHL